MFSKAACPASELHAGDFRGPASFSERTRRKPRCVWGRPSIGHFEKSNDSTGSERMVCQSSVLAPMTARPERSMSRSGTEALTSGEPNNHINAPGALRFLTKTRGVGAASLDQLESGFGCSSSVDEGGRER